MSVAFRRDLTTGTPMLMFETNMPSITSTCSQSAELTRWTSRPRSAKSADRMEGAMRVIVQFIPFFARMGAPGSDRAAHPAALSHRIRQAAAETQAPGLPRPGAPGPPPVFPRSPDRPRRRRPGRPPHHIAPAFGAGPRSCAGAQTRENGIVSILSVFFLPVNGNEFLTGLLSPGKILQYAGSSALLPLLM